MYESFGAVIPAYNEEERIADVLRRLKTHIPARQIAVVDDGSLDSTADVSAAEAVSVVRHDRNRGKGEALKSGFRRLNALGGIVAAIVLDADGQHDPEEIPRFIERYENTDADIIVGDRMSDTTDMPSLRLWTNRVTSRIVSLRAGCRINDSQSGFRLIKLDLMSRIELVTSHFDTESEILIKAGRLGARIDSLPIATIYAGEGSSIRPALDTIRFLGLFFRSFFW